jgi:hypothetical protein
MAVDLVPRQRRAIFAAAVLTAAMLLPATALAQAAPSQRPNFTGIWSLYDKGRKVEVRRWIEEKVMNGMKFGGQEVRGPYSITQEQNGLIAIRHDNIVWMIGLPSGNVFTAYRTAEGYGLGPELGSPVFLQLRARAGAHELEIWRAPDEGATPKYTFTGYTFVREGQAKSAPALPRGGVF